VPVALPSLIGTPRAPTRALPRHAAAL